MKETQKKLMTTFVVSITLALLLVVAGEAGWLPEGMLADRKNTEFVVLSVMELLTICTIPLALRLFKFQRVRRDLASAGGLRRWGLARMLPLSGLMLLNVLLYYLFVNPAFGYMGIIVFLCMFFIVPTRSRCENEIEK